MQDMVMITIKDEIKENAACLSKNSETCSRLSDDFARFKSNIESKLARLTPSLNFK